MNLPGILRFSLVFFFLSCSNEEFLDKSENLECYVEDAIKTKELAKLLIVGKWNWIKTTYASRGVEKMILTPESENEIKTYEFTNNKLKIFSNDTLTEELNYTIQFWGEGTNTVDEILVVVYETGGRSILFLNKSGDCLSLVNSYNDAGGDLNFVRMSN